METKTVLTILLVGSIGLNIYCYFNREGELVPNPDCVITEGFDTPKEISEEDAQRFSAEYKISLPDNDTTIGGIITRTALEEILCTSNCNAIAYSLARDESGSFGPAENGVFIVLTGVDVVLDPETRKITSVRRVDTNNYIGGYWCPPSCVPY